MDPIINPDLTGQFIKKKKMCVTVLTRSACWLFSCVVNAHQHGPALLLTFKFSLKPTLCACGSLLLEEGEGGQKTEEKNRTISIQLTVSLLFSLSLSLGISSAERPTGKGGS